MLEVISEGEFSSVVKAVKRTTNELFAVKVFFWYLVCLMQHRLNWRGKSLHGERNGDIEPGKNPHVGRSIIRTSSNFTRSTSGKTGNIWSWSS